MQFENLNMFHLFWLLFILVFFFYWSHKRKQKITESFIEPQLLKEVNRNTEHSRNILKMVLIGGVVALSIVALARPQWGFQWREIKREAVDILVVVDTSKSMLTQDVKPNRLERTRLAVMDLLKKLKGDRIGLIAFSGDAFMVCPLTVDYNGFVLSLNALSTSSIPVGGTNLEAAISESLKSYDNTLSQHKAVIIITDGDNLEGDPLKVAKVAKEKGIKIFTIGIGTREGELIRIRNSRGDEGYLKDSKGNVVKSRLNERILQDIALTTGGVYVKASGAQFGLDYLYDQQISKMQRREVESKKEKRFNERFQIPLSMALLLLVTETCLSTRKKKKQD